MNASARPVLPRFSSVAEAITALKPVEPVYCLQPAKYREAARRFLETFPGDALYAVKANPHPYVLHEVYAAGIRHFDTASLGEVKLVKGLFPDAICHFMAPVRLPGHAKAAFHDFGVTDFVVDCDFELDKLIAETGAPDRLRIFVRLSTQFGGAMLELSSKFGTNVVEGARLLKRVAALGAKPCLTFHVGSQCLSPFSYAQAIELARRTVEKAGIEIAALDIGGGFPGPDVNWEVPPYHWYFDTIREALTVLERPELPIMCEPGRALISEGLSLITQVVLRKGDRLYINDGIYGSFDELTLPGFDVDYPAQAMRLDDKDRAVPLPGLTQPFRIYGPTCDTLDVLPRPRLLPVNIAPGDFIVFDAVGAYTVSSRTPFNGFWNDNWVQIGE